MKIRLQIVLFLFAISIVSSVSAQKKDPMAMMTSRASRLIDSTMSAINLRAERFNQELQVINQTKPLDAASLTPEKIPSSITKVKDFLGYLEVHRALSVRLRKMTDDSVKAMRSEMPTRVREDFLKEFLEAYHKDQESFDKYTLALTKVYVNVSEVLKFLAGEISLVGDKHPKFGLERTKAKISLVGDKIQFESKEDYEHYQEMMDAVNKSNKKLITASADSQKATLEASEAMQKAYGTGAK